MKTRKKSLLASLCFAIAGVTFLFMVFEERIIDGGPLHYTWLGLAITFFALAVVSFARGRESGGGTGPPNA
jgi:hypothetical protein